MTTTDARRVVDLRPGDLGIAITSHDDLVGNPVIVITGEIDAATAPGLTSCFRAAAARRASAITVDLAGVPFMDSSGINALVDLCALVTPRGGTVVVTGAAGNVRRVCDLTGLAENQGLVLR